MAETGQSLRRDILKVWVQYLAFGVGCVPAGLACAFLTRHGGAQIGSLASTIPIALLLGGMMWFNVSVWFDLKATLEAPEFQALLREMVKSERHEETQHAEMERLKGETRRVLSRLHAA